MVGFFNINMAQQLQALQTLQTLAALGVGQFGYITRDWRYANVKPLQATWNVGNKATYLSEQHTTSKFGVS
jgi:hypothetical protein